MRSAEAEAALNELALSTFTTPSGREFLRYLKAITINSVCGPEVSDAALRHREGMRNLVGIIETRMSLGGQSEPTEPKPARRSRTAAAGRPAGGEA